MIYVGTNASENEQRSKKLNEQMYNVSAEQCRMQQFNKKKLVVNTQMRF